MVTSIAVEKDLHLTFTHFKIYFILAKSAFRDHTFTSSMFILLFLSLALTGKQLLIPRRPPQCERALYEVQHKTHSTTFKHKRINRTIFIFAYIYIMYT